MPYNMLSTGVQSYWKHGTCNTVKTATVPPMHLARPKTDERTVQMHCSC